MGVYVDTNLDVLVRAIHECKPFGDGGTLFLYCPDCKGPYHQEAGNHSAWDCWELHQNEERHTKYLLDRATPSPHD